MCIAALLLFMSSAAHAADFPAMVHDLNGLQNRMALGGASSDAVARRSEDIGKWIANANPDVWQDDRNIGAAVVYLLGGGALQALRDMRDAGFIAAPHAPLLEAALAYAGGLDGSGKALMAFDAHTLPPVLGGHLALVQGGWMIGSDKARAADLFDLAILLMPVSLVEEAALRREIALLDPGVEGAKLVRLAHRYASRYLASPFAPQFWEIFKRIAPALFQKVEEPLRSRIESVIEKATPNERIDLRLALCREAILGGRLDDARRNLAKTGATDRISRQRAEFYQATIDLLTNAPDPPDLLTSRAASLGAEDRRLAAIASSALKRIASPSAAQQDDSVGGALPIFAHAKRALDESDALLKRADGR
ncbi:MAG: hypothetical protein CTY15_04205 [Methylocystis sp.]|nr:MAG: hypothetical protein CTY15_04205 [Methylocystis sp.]